MDRIELGQMGDAEETEPRIAPGFRNDATPLLDDVVYNAAQLLLRSRRDFDVAPCLGRNPGRQDRDGLSLLR